MLLSVKMLSQSRLLAHFKSNSTISGLIRFCLELLFCLLSIGFLKIKQSVHFPRRIPSSLKSTKQKFAQTFLLSAHRLIWSLQGAHWQFCSVKERKSGNRKASAPCLRKPVNLSSESNRAFWCRRWASAPSSRQTRFTLMLSYSMRRRRFSHRMLSAQSIEPSNWLSWVTLSKCRPVTSSMLPSKQRTTMKKLEM